VGWAAILDNAMWPKMMAAREGKQVQGINPRIKEAMAKPCVV
jgi:hypothetical protein